MIVKYLYVVLPWEYVTEFVTYTTDINTLGSVKSVFIFG